MCNTSPQFVVNLYYSLQHSFSLSVCIYSHPSSAHPLYHLFSYYNTPKPSVLQQILIRTGKLLESGTILETLEHTDHDTISTLMGKIKQLMTDFDDRLGKRKKKIDESVQLHKLTEMVRNLKICVVCR